VPPKAAYRPSSNTRLVLGSIWLTKAVEPQRSDALGEYGTETTQFIDDPPMLPQPVDAVGSVSNAPEADIGS
jgi:hypothetical protein